MNEAVDPPRGMVAIFCERDLEEIVELPVDVDAHSYSLGVQKGGRFYGAGSCLAFVLPDDLEEIRRDQPELFEQLPERWRSAIAAADHASGQ